MNTITISYVSNSLTYFLKKTIKIDFYYHYQYYVRYYGNVKAIFISIVEKNILNIEFFRFYQNFNLNLKIF